MDSHNQIGQRLNLSYGRINDAAALDYGTVTSGSTPIDDSRSAGCLRAEGHPMAHEAKERSIILSYERYNLDPTKWGPGLELLAGS